MFFHSPAAANKVTGLHLTTIKTILERGGNPTYHRKSDNKLFEIRKEDPIKILEIEGEDFFSLEEIQAKFGLSPTKFLNQVKNDQFAKKIDWISPELFSGSEASNESETEKIDERSEAELALEILREEMRSQFEKYQAEMSNLHAEISRLPPKWLRWLLAQQKFLLRLRKFSNPKLFFRWTLLILILLRDLSERELLGKFNRLGPKLTDMF